MSDPTLDFMRLFRMVQDELRTLRAKHEDLERRHNNLFREARVTKVDAEKAMAEVEADGLPSDMLPWLARAGKQREWDPLTVDERVIMINPSGEPGMGLILPGGFSSKFPQNHNKLGEHKRSVGDKVHTTTTDSLKKTETEKVTRTQAPDHDVVQVGETKFASYDGKNVSDAAKTIIRTKLRVACGDSNVDSA